MTQTPRIFVGCMATGFVWADRWVIEHGDYKTLARMPYDTLELCIQPECPLHLNAEIVREATRLQAKRGQPYHVTTTQTLILGAG
jgi:hypothetical protein